MNLRNCLAILISLCALTESCKSDHRMGRRAKDERKAQQDSATAAAANGTANASNGTAAPSSSTSDNGNSSPAGAQSIEEDYPASMTEVASECRSQVAGIDISHWDGTIDWNKVNGESIYFVYIKATEGTDFIDPSFETNWTGIRSTSLRRGAYLFYVPELSAADQTVQAQNFIQTVKDLQDGDLPPMLDVEDDPEIPVAAFQNGLLLVARQIRNHFNVSPIIYTTTGLYKKYLKPNDSFQSYELWIADYRYKRPELCDKKNMRIWQFTDKARIKGISGPVDMDIFYTTPEDLENLIVRK
jgi:lysozyme